MASRLLTARLVLVSIALSWALTLPYFSRLMNANERPRLLQGRALVQEGTGAIDGPSVGHINPGIDVSRRPGGRLYPNKPPGASVPAAAAWVVVEAAGVPTLAAHTQLARVLGAWLPAFLLLLLGLRRLDRAVDRPAATVAVAVLALSTPWWAYSKVLFGHTLAGLCLFGGTALLVDAVREGGARWRPILGGAVASAAVTVEYMAAFAALPLGLLLLGRVRAPGGAARLGLGLAGALVPVVLLMAYHQVAFGGPLETGYHHVVRPEFARIHDRGLLGLGWPGSDSIFEHLWSPWGGLLYFAPVAIVALVGLVAASRQEGPAALEPRVHLGIFVTLLLVTLGLTQTGGWRVGPRYLVMALPFLLTGLAHGAHRFRFDPRWTVTLAALAGWGLFANGLAANLFPHLIPVGHPLADLLVPLWISGAEPPGWLPATMPAVQVSLALGVLALGIALGGAVRVGDSRLRWVVVVGGLVLGLGAGAVAGTAGTVEGSSELAAVRSLWNRPAMP